MENKMNQIKKNLNDEELLLKLTKEKNISYELILRLVAKAKEFRYQERQIGVKDDISDLIKEYANKKVNK
jgi:hypothetical protein